MSKMKAILNYLFYQTRYELALFWSINAIFILFFTILASLIPDKVNFTIFPSGPIYVLVAIAGSKWINRTLSYLLRLGVNRLQYALGSVAFIAVYNVINSLIVLIFYGIYKLLVYLVVNRSIEYLHPSQIFTSEPTLLHTFLTDFLLLNIVMMIFMLVSLSFHRLGKLGSYLIFAGLGALIILSVSLGWLKPIIEFIFEANFTVITLSIFIILLLLATLFITSLRNVSITCAQK